MDQFDTTHDELQVGGLPLSLLAERVGQTPFYAYDRSLIAARVAGVRQVLPQGVHLHYAIKANPMPALVGFMRPLVDGMDVASAGELKLALDAGADPRTIGFAGPGKRDAELRQAVAAGVLLHVESARELEALVYAKPDDALGSVICAALLASPRASGRAGDDNAALMAHCSKHLPAFMLPKVLQWVEQPLPRSPNGKLDRQRWMLEHGSIRHDPR